MPADEYASTVRGGLKLKGGAPAGIKKKKKKPKTSTSDTKSALQAALEDADTDLVKGKSKDGVSEEGLRDEEDGQADMKTASERAYEEMRRKRLHDRLEKEGVKSHKQRVEELNKYLSKLSEHHDMYVFLLVLR